MNRIFPFANHGVHTTFKRLSLILAILFAVLLFSLLVQPVFAQQTGTVSAGITLNVRSGPGANNSIIGRVSGGTALQILETDASGAWLRVTSSAFSGEGWVAAAYVTTGAANATAAPTAQPSNGGTTVVVRVPKLNVRSGPGTNNAILTSLTAGVTLQVISTSAGWHQVNAPGLAQPGWVLASLTGPSGGAVQATAAQQPAAVNVPPVAAPRPAGGGSFIYGIQANMWQGDKAGSAAAVNELGFLLTKQQVRWEFAEPEPGAINWQEMDDIINTMNAAGINVLFSVVTSPPWTRPNKGGTGGPPEDFNLYANFVGQIAGRYCGRLLAIEVWNEQNLQREWEGFPLNPASYMDLLRRAYSSIKAACPSVLVISGAPTPAGYSDVAFDDVDYIRGMYNNGLARYCDGVGIHPSGFGNPPDVTFNDWQAGRYSAESHVNHRSFYFLSTLQESRAVMVQYGDSNKRLWLTEFGWASSQSPHPGYEYAGRISEQMQAQYIKRAFEIARDSGYVGGAILWNLNYNFGEMSQFMVQGRPAFGTLKSLTGR